MIQSKLTRTEADDPRRCQAIFTNGQCPYKAAEDSTMCPMHGGNKKRDSMAQASLRNYSLGQWQSRVEDFATNPQIKNLREEIGILRIMLERIILSCNDQVSLIMYSGKISEMVMKIEKLVVTCHRLESSLGMMIDKLAAQQLSDEIVSIISEFVVDPNVVTQIADRIGVTVSNIGGKLDSKA